MDAHKHVNFDKSDRNIYIKNQSLESAYEELFGEAVLKYNAKQKRKDRRIENYLAKVKKDGKLDVQREFIIQLGDMSLFNEGERVGADGAESNRRLFGDLLTEYVDGFQERNPQLHVYNAVVHLDEATPHLHLNVIPVAEGYKRGLEVQPSFSKALSNQGFTSTGKYQYIDFRNQEVGKLEEVLHSVNASRKEVGTNDFEDMHEFKAYQRKLDCLKAEIKTETAVYQDYKQWNVQFQADNQRLELGRGILDKQIADRKKALAELPTVEAEKERIAEEIQGFTFAKFKERFFDFAREAKKGTFKLRELVIHEVIQRLPIATENAFGEELERQQRGELDMQTLTTYSNERDYYDKHEDEIEECVDNFGLFDLRAEWKPEDYQQNAFIYAYNQQISALVTEHHDGKLDVSEELFGKSDDFGRNGYDFEM